MRLAFTKMHGLGNDFIVFDAPTDADLPSASALRQLADRHSGIGFDQALALTPSRAAGIDVFYRIFNSDGSEVEQCANGARCIAALVARRLGRGTVQLQSPGGRVTGELHADGSVSLDMGVPNFDPASLPFEASREADIYPLRVGEQELQIGAVSMGNPHAVIEVSDVSSAPLASLGEALSTNAHFPQSCNVGAVQIVDRAHVKLRVRERGAGETLACGTGACAAVAVLRRRAKVDGTVAVDLPGGRLEIRWDGPGHTLWMTGPAAFVYEGDWNE